MQSGRNGRDNKKLNAFVYSYFSVRCFFHLHVRWKEDRFSRLALPSGKAYITYLKTKSVNSRVCFDILPQCVSCSRIIIIIMCCALAGKPQCNGREWHLLLWYSLSWITDGMSKLLHDFQSQQVPGGAYCHTVGEWHFSLLLVWLGFCFDRPWPAGPAKKEIAWPKQMEEVNKS